MSKLSKGLIIAITIIFTVLPLFITFAVVLPRMISVEIQTEEVRDMVEQAHEDIEVRKEEIQAQIEQAHEYIENGKASVQERVGELTTQSGQVQLDETEDVVIP